MKAEYLSTGNSPKAELLLNHTTYKSCFNNRDFALHSWKPESPSTCVVGIVHGLGEHSGRYHAVAEQLVANGCQVIGFDQQGHGRTGGNLPTFESLLRDLESFTSHLHSLHNKVFLYGQSLGGGLVINFALRNRPSIQGVIASSPLLKPTRKPPAWKLMVARTLGKIWPSMTLSTGIDPNTLTHDPIEIEKYLSDPLVHHRVSAALGITMLDAGEWALKNAASLQIPTLLMHGEADQVTSAECSREFAELAGSYCQLRTWENMYHDLHFETVREQVLRCVTDWIATNKDRLNAT